MSKRYAQRGWQVSLPVLPGFDRRTAFFELLEVRTPAAADAYVERHVETYSDENRRKVTEVVLREATTLASCAQLYSSIRAVEAGRLGMSELRRLMRDEVLRLHHERGHWVAAKSDKDYLWNLGQLLLNIVDSRITDTRARLVRNVEGPLAFTFMLQGRDVLAEVYLHFAAHIIERRPLVPCAAPDCGQLFEPWGKTRYHETRCQNRHRKQRWQARKRASVPTSVPTTVGNLADNRGPRRNQIEPESVELSAN